MERRLLLLGLATCQLPLFVAVAVGWWSPWAGVAAGVSVAVLFGVLWSRRAGQPRFLLGIAAGLAFAIMGASLMLPSLRMLLGALPSYQLASARELGGGTPMAVEVMTIDGGAPRTDLVHMGEVFRTRGEGGTFFLYSVVAPVVPAGWTKSEPVPAWVICELSRESPDEQEIAQKDCVALLAQPAIYEREGFDGDLPNAPMVAEAMARHALAQAEDAPVFVLHQADDGWRGIIAPLLLLVVSIGAVKGAVKAHLEASRSSADH
jgi:hypothetical protein